MYKNSSKPIREKNIKIYKKYEQKTQTTKKYMQPINKQGMVNIAYN